MKNKKKSIIIIIIIIAISLFFINFKIYKDNCCSCYKNIKSDEMCIAKCCESIRIEKRK